MAEELPLPSYLFVLGPSCSGKSSFALKIAEVKEISILNTDSVQVFEEVDIGTAKPSPLEKKRVPHWMYDRVPSGAEYSVANYLNDTLECIQNSLSDQDILFCGGSGFYIQALEKGLYPGGETSQEIKDKVWDYIERKGFEGAYNEIALRDPEYIEKISPNDHYRIRRSLEILFSQGLSITALRQKMVRDAHSPLPKHRRKKVGFLFTREEQRLRVEKRAQKMLQMGWIEEVQKLLNRGFENWSPLRSVGYKEIVEHLQGCLSERELLEKIVTSTMQLIKKQTTWFKRDKDIRWYEPNQFVLAEEECLEWLNSKVMSIAKSSV